MTNKKSYRQNKNKKKICSFSCKIPVPTFRSKTKLMGQIWRHRIVSLWSSSSVLAKSTFLLTASATCSVLHLTRGFFTFCSFTWWLWWGDSPWCERYWGEVKTVVERSADTKLSSIWWLFVYLTPPTESWSWRLKNYFVFISKMLHLYAKSIIKKIKTQNFILIKRTI